MKFENLSSVSIVAIFSAMNLDLNCLSNTLLPTTDKVVGR